MRLSLIERGRVQSEDSKKQLALSHPNLLYGKAIHNPSKQVESQQKIKCCKAKILMICLTCEQLCEACVLYGTVMLQLTYSPDLNSTKVNNFV